MPNHVRNMLSYSGEPELVKEFLDRIKGVDEDGVVRAIDFNSVIPMPPELNISDSSDGDAAMRHILGVGTEGYDDFEWIKFKSFRTVEQIEQAIELGRQYIENLKNHGCKTWYDWSRNNWGTKWNAYDIEHNVCSPSSGCISFDTAWAAPIEVITKIAATFPEIHLDYIFADEDTSYNTGRGFSDNGELYMSYPTGGSDEAYELYFQTHEEYRDEWEKVDGEWRYKEDYEEA